MTLKNVQLLKMLASLCLISTLAILHSYSHLSSHDMVAHEESYGSREQEQASRFKVKRDIKSIEEPKTKLVKWFRNVINNPDLAFEEYTNAGYKDHKAQRPLLSDDMRDQVRWLDKCNIAIENANFHNTTVNFDENNFCRKVLKIQSIQSDFIEGQPNGKSIITYHDGSYTKANFKDGILQGYLTKFWCRFGDCDLFEMKSWRIPRHLQEISYYDNGIRIGIAYEFKVGGGFIVGQVDQLGNMTGNDIAYVYPDFESMLVGEFKNGELVSGYAAELVDFTSSPNGFLKPLYELKGHETMSFSQSNDTFIGQGPLIRDPMEEKYLYVSNSTIKDAGRGVFLKRKASKGQVIGYYNGVRMSDVESKLKLEDRKSQYRMDNDWAKPNQVINIPSKMQDLKQYNATVGHLINHSKKPNVWFGMVDHIRFGKIRSIVMLKDVSANQELFVDYGYLEQYAASDTAIKTILGASKWLTNMDDESFHSEMKYHIHYLRSSVDKYKPYLHMLKGISNYLTK